MQVKDIRLLHVYIQEKTCRNHMLLNTSCFNSEYSHTVFYNSEIMSQMTLMSHVLQCYLSSTNVGTKIEIKQFFSRFMKLVPALPWVHCDASHLLQWKTICYGYFGP